MSWAPYLLNLFLENCKDTQEWGSELHYSWLLILIGHIGWKKPVYNKYMERPGKCGATRYISLCSSADPKRKKTNTNIFAGTSHKFRTLLWTHGTLHQRLSRSFDMLPTLGKHAIVCGCKQRGIKPRNGYNSNTASRRRRSKDRSKSGLRNGRYQRFQPQ
jgi:hypothetical protein